MAQKVQVTKNQFMQSLKELFPEIINGKDKAAKRELFTNMKDSYHREGKITDHQCFTWVYPSSWDGKGVGFFGSKRNR